MQKRHHVLLAMAARHQNHLHAVVRMGQAVEAHPIQVHAAFAQANKETRKC